MNAFRERPARKLPRWLPDDEPRWLDSERRARAVDHRSALDVVARGRAGRALLDRIITETMEARHV